MWVILQLCIVGLFSFPARSKKIIIYSVECHHTHTYIPAYCKSSNQSHFLLLAQEGSVVTYLDNKKEKY
jgi:hypothetical protein